MPEPRYQRVAVVGVGLIGGSVALAVRERGLAATVVGVASSPERARAIASLGVADEMTDDTTAAAEGADLVVVCTPVGLVAPLVLKAAAAAGDRAILTDAGSTKLGVVGDVEPRLGGPCRFVGAHPLAGDHRTGPEAARADLFDGATTVVTPTPRSDPAAVAAVCSFWEALGSRVERMPPERHDEVVALTSHVPHVAAAAVAAVTPDEALGFTAGGWADTTRVAAGSPTLWRDILTANRAAVDDGLARLGEEINAYREALAGDDADRLVELLERGRRQRIATGGRDALGD